jgi:hypothetical protein
MSQDESTPGSPASPKGDSNNPCFLWRYFPGQWSPVVGPTSGRTMNKRNAKHQKKIADACQLADGA